MYAVPVQSKEPERGITIEPQKESFLLGEPVLLRIRYKNVGTENLIVPEYWFEGGEPPIEIYISEDGITFSRFKFGYPMAEPLGLSRQSLQPGASWSYDLRLLYTRFSSGMLAFEKPGEYFLKIRKSLAKPNDIRRESKVLRVKIIEPTGVDAEVWKRIRDDKKVFELVQSARGPKEPALTVAALLREFPKSNYRATLWHGLREFYYKQGSRLRPEGEEIRKVLGFQEVDTFADPRLDGRIRAVEGREITVGDLLRELSLQTGISLEAATELKTTTVPVSLTIRLRDCMRTVSSQMRAPWWPQADGYFLSREPPAESKSTK
ncbi:MAG: hypothetical protein L0215_13255 [Gemmataceae bacterium]|nr:hypothetical protein [Gemmataceae bacterium]